MVAGNVLRVRNVLYGLLNQLFACVADDRAVLFVDAQEPAAGGVGVSDSHGRIFEGAAEPLLALAQRSSFRTRSMPKAISSATEAAPLTSSPGAAGARTGS